MILENMIASDEIFLLSLMTDTSICILYSLYNLILGSQNKSV